MQNNKTDRTLFLISFIAQLTITMVNFSLVYFLRDIHGFSSSEIGIASSIYTIFYFVFCIVFERTFVKTSKKTKVIVSLLGMALSIAFLLLLHGRILVFSTLSLYGIAMALLWPNIETWISEKKEGKALSLSVSHFNFSWSFGAGLSTALGGLLSGINVAFPLAISIVFFSIAAIFTLSISYGGEDEKIVEEAGKDKSTPLRFFCWIGVLMIYIGYSLILTIFPLYSSEYLGFSEGLTGMLLLFRGVTACFSFVYLGRTVFWQFKISVIFLTQGCFIILSLILSFLSSPILFVPFFICFGLVFALAYVLSIFHGASGAVDRAKRMMVHEVLLTVGTIIGSLFGGIIYDNFSFTTVLYAISSFGGVVLLAEIVLYMVKREKMAIRAI